ncbi:MAG: hypothetical protein NC121_16425 [Blautia sp.]|nr:hypothetical protein [Blautia sp.]
MKKFDRKMKKLFKNLEVPSSYDEKVDQLLIDIMKKEPILEKKKRSRSMLRFAVCLLCILGAVSLYTIDAKANIFEAFKETIMDFLGRGNSEEDIAEMGVETEKQLIESKPDLMMELQESVIDSHGIYLMVKITASSGIRFEEDVLFDYFCFCKGTNYSVYQLLSGVTSCELLEVNEDRPNIATYVVSLMFDETLEEGSAVTACFRDLTKGPYSDNPELLVEGLWSITFDFYPTVIDRVEIEGTPEMVFPFIDTTAAVTDMELTPFGLMVRADVSNFPSDKLGVSDNSVAVRLKMIDGSELTVASHDPAEDCCTQSGYVSVSSEEDKTYQQMNWEFTNMINVGKVMGVYIEDLYIPLK